MIESSAQAQLAGFLDSIAVAATAESPVKIGSGAIPPYLLKGVNAAWPVTAVPTSGHPADWLRLSLVSTETPRPNPQGKRRKVKRGIVAFPEQALSLWAGKGTLKVSVPLDVADPAIDFVIKADVVSNPYSNRVLATCYSTPFRMLVQDPVGLQVDPASLKLASGSTAKLRGTLVRHPGFKGTVSVAVMGLPAGYSAAPVTVAGDQSKFDVPINVPKEPARGPFRTSRSPRRLGRAKLPSRSRCPSRLLPWLHLWQPRRPPNRPQSRPHGPSNLRRRPPRNHADPCRPDGLVRF